MCVIDSLLLRVLNDTHCASHMAATAHYKQLKTRMRLPSPQDGRSSKLTAPTAMHSLRCLITHNGPLTHRRLVALQDGRSSALTAPNGPAQSEMLDHTHNVTNALMFGGIAGWPQQRTDRTQRPCTV